MQMKINHLHLGRDPANREEQPTNQKNHQEEYNYQYYEEYKRIYQTAYYLSIRLKTLLHDREHFWSKLLQMEKKTEEFKDDIRGEPPEKKKRTRRTAQEIERRYICSVEKCLKCYGSEGSLQQHIKLKHPQLYELRSQQSGSKNPLDQY